MPLQHQLTQLHLFSASIINKSAAFINVVRTLNSRVDTNKKTTRRWLFYLYSNFLNHATTQSSEYLSITINEII